MKKTKTRAPTVAQKVVEVEKVVKEKRILLTLGGKEHELTEEEARAIYNALGVALGDGMERKLDIFRKQSEEAYRRPFYYPPQTTEYPASKPQWLPGKIYCQDGSPS